MNWLRFAFRNLFRNKRRAATTLLITAIGTATVLAASGFVLYNYDGLRRLAAFENGHLILGDPRHFEDEEETPMAFGLQGYAELQRELEADPRVRAALPRAELTGLISNGDKSTIFMGTGIDPREFKVRGPVFKLLEGELLAEAFASADEPQVLLAKDLARTLKGKVGDGLTLLSTTANGALNALDVKVTGIFTSGVPELDARMILVHLGTAQSLLASHKATTLSVYLRDTDLTEPMAKEVRSRHPDLGVRTWEDLATFYHKVKALYNRIFATLGVIIVVMVFFAIYNTMSMVVVERTREIGTLIALGAYRWEIVRNFLLESALLGAIGSGLGALLAATISLALRHSHIMMPPPPGRTEGYPLLIYFYWDVALVIMLLVILTSAAAAWLAARRGARKNIVEALAHV